MMLGCIEGSAVAVWILAKMATMMVVKYIVICLCDWRLVWLRLGGKES
jgi:hypothetical protein